MKKVIKLVLLIAMMSLIFSFSSQIGDDSTSTSNFVMVILHNCYRFIIKNGLDFIAFNEKYIKFVRKLAHFSEFGMLGLLAYLNSKEYLKKRHILYSILFCFLYACSDEIHQYFVPNRVCALFDVMIDTLGATSGILLIHFISKKCLKK